jgi:cell wall-associated NlpC family hydrolase
MRFWLIDNPICQTPSVAVICAALCLATSGLSAETPEPKWRGDLSYERRSLLESALAYLKANPAIPYRLGSANATGMDCSGAIYFLLKQADQEPPRSAHQQYLWMKKLGRLSKVPTTARTEDDPAFAALRPGDLVFYAHDVPNSRAEIRASHVHIYLGKEADGHAIMIGSSEGRSYRGKKLSGFGITDFHVSKAGSPTRIVAYGPPPPVAFPTSPALKPKKQTTTRTKPTP